MKANTEAKQAYTVALENKVSMATVEIQNMKSVTQTVAEVVQAKQSKMMGNASAGLAAPGTVVGVTKGWLLLPQVHWGFD